jgi:hypothetical protein
MNRLLSLSLLLPGLAVAGLHVNQIGYDLDGPKIAVFGDSTGARADSFTLANASGTVVLSGKSLVEGSVPGWGKASHWDVDFSSVQTEGKYTLTVLPAGVSDTVRIGSDLLFSQTVGPVLGYFRSVRNTDATQHSVQVYGRPGVTRDAYGGWKDASGDAGRYLSHQSTANFMNPQQIPLVDWSLLKSWELDSSAMPGRADSIRQEAGWGADFLLRMLDPDSSFFYMNVFDQWGAAGVPWYLCSWYGSAGTFSTDYQCAWREGGGMAIAALARSARMGASGDSLPAQYLAGAQRAWSVLIQNGTLWDDDHKQNLIDDYCALLANVELYKATGTAMYKDSAAGRAASILHRQQPAGWFAIDDSVRPYYHPVDEGLPMVALLEYLDIAPESQATVSASIKAALAWYKQLSYQVANPYAYARIYRPTLVASTSGGAVDYASGASVYASGSQDGYPPANAVDGQTSTRWGSPLGDSTAWFRVDLGDTILLDSVDIDWETAYPKTFRLVTSLDSAGTVGADSATYRPTASGWQSFPLSGQKVRWIRVQAVELQQTYYGMSFYELEAFGRPVPSTAPVSSGTAAFFMPHVNETGYWWQGENARLGSMATAFYLAGRRLIPEWDPMTDTLGRMAQAQLDWVAGRNPFDMCFLYGFGANNSPAYSSYSNVTGGIANGVTSDTLQELAPAFNPPVPQAWENWRWVEQWIPHSAWWLLGVSAQRWANHQTPLDTATGIRQSVVHPVGMRLVGSGGHWAVLFSSSHPAGSLRMVDLRGRILWETRVGASVRQAALPSAYGLHLLRFQGEDGREAVLPVPGF